MTSKADDLKAFGPVNISDKKINKLYDKAKVEGDFERYIRTSVLSCLLDYILNIAVPFGWRATSAFKPEPIKRNNFVQSLEHLEDYEELLYHFICRHRLFNRFNMAWFIPNLLNCTYFSVLPVKYSIDHSNIPTCCLMDFHPFVMSARLYRLAVSQVLIGDEEKDDETHLGSLRFLQLANRSLYVQLCTSLRASEAITLPKLVKKVPHINDYDGLTISGYNDQTIPSEPKNHRGRTIQSSDQPPRSSRSESYTSSRKKENKQNINTKYDSSKYTPALISGVPTEMTLEMVAVKLDVKFKLKPREFWKSTEQGIYTAFFVVKNEDFEKLKREMFYSNNRPLRVKKFVLNHPTSKPEKDKPERVKPNKTGKNWNEGTKVKSTGEYQR